MLTRSEGVTHAEHPSGHTVFQTAAIKASSKWAQILHCRKCTITQVLTLARPPTLCTLQLPSRHELPSWQHTQSPLWAGTGTDPSTTSQAVTTFIKNQSKLFPDSAQKPSPPRGHLTLSSGHPQGLQRYGGPLRATRHCQRSPPTERAAEHSTLSPYFSLSLEITDSLSSL